MYSKSTSRQINAFIEYLRFDRRLGLLSGIATVALYCVPIASLAYPQHSGTQGVTDTRYRYQTSPSSRVLGSLFGEVFLAENVSVHRERAAVMSAEERFEYLAGWVLPSERHSSIRMSGVFTQTDPAAVAFFHRSSDDPNGGELVSPVFGLLEVAKELGRLEELLQRISEIRITPDDSEEQQRARAALLLLVNLEIDDEAAVSKAAEELLPLVTSATPSGMAEMWPETLVVYRGMQRPKQHPDIIELLNTLYSRRTELSIPKGNAQWHAHVSALMLQHRYAEERRLAKPAESPNALDGWIPVGRTLARTRGRGAPHADWSWNGQSVRHRSSHDNDFLFLQSPMRGNFAIEGDIVGYGVTQVLAAGQFFGPKYSHEQLETGTFRKGPSVQKIDPPFSRLDPWVHFRVAFRDGVCTKFINGRPVVSEQLPEHFDPWIGFRNWYKSYGGCRDVRITGMPEIPDAVEMSASSDMIGWLPYFEAPIGYASAHWRYAEDSENGGQIIGRRSNNLSGTFYESLLRYHRPLSEDGSVEYEFYYEPGKVHTHPTLDRLTFLLDPAGVRIHWVTDGTFDRTNVSPDNAFDEPQHRRGPRHLPLKESAWNQIKLRTVGNRVTLELNDQLIFERELESTNRRTFGLFYYADKTESRVRNVRMQANWPRTVLPVSEQRLVDPVVVSLDAELSTLKSVFRHDFSKDGLPQEFFKTADSDKRGLIELRSGGPLKSQSGGVFAARPSTGTWASIDLRLPFSIYGDYDIEASFEQLQLESDKDGCIMLVTHSDDDNQHMCRNIRILTQAAKQQLHSSLSLLHVDGSRSYGSRDQTSCEANAGRLRLARRGDVVYYLFAENDSREFRIVGREETSDKPIRPDGVQLRALCNGGGEVRVTWKDVTVRAERMTYLPTDKAAEPRRLYTMKSDGSDLQIVTGVPDGFAQFGSPEWSTDGKQIAFDASDGGTATSHVMVINVDGSNLRDLGLGCMPSFSSDGQQIVFSQPGQGIVMMSSDGSDREVIDRSGWGVQWSPDGNHIAYGKAGNITIMNPDTRDERLLFIGEQATRFSQIYWNLGWSHDSQWICTKVRNRRSGQEEVIVANIDAPEELTVLHSAVNGINPDFTWDPTNRNVLFAMYNPAHKGPQLFLSSQAKPAQPTLLPGQPLDQMIYDCAWSPDGKRIVFSGRQVAQEVEWPRSASESSMIP